LFLGADNSVDVGDGFVQCIPFVWGEELFAAGAIDLAPLERLEEVVSGLKHFLIPLVQVGKNPTEGGLLFGVGKIPVLHAGTDDHLPSGGGFALFLTVEDVGLC